MATPNAAVVKLARAIGQTPLSLDRTLRDLRGAGAAYWPMSGKGGGKAASHVEARHMAALILALSAPVATDAYKVVDALRSLRAAPNRQVTPPFDALPEVADMVRTTVTVPTPPHIAAQTFGERLEGMITAAAAAMVQGDDDALDALRAEGWCFNLAPDLPAAWAFWQTPEGVALSDQYQPAQPTLLFAAALEAPKALVRRSLSFGFALIEIAAELVADTMRRQQTRRADPALPLGGPENKDPSPARDRGLDTDGLTPTGTPARGLIDTPEPTAGERTAQILSAVPVRDGRQPSKRKRKGLSDARSHPSEPAAA